MNDGPKWHGWATPEQVREMMFAMIFFLQENKEFCPFMITNAPNAELCEIFGRKSAKQI